MAKTLNGDGESHDIQRLPAEQLYSDELAALAREDHASKPPGWRLSPESVRRFILGDPAKGIRGKFVGDPALVDRARVALATNRGLMLIGEPGTAKSLLSELLAAAISGQSRSPSRGARRRPTIRSNIRGIMRCRSARGRVRARWCRRRCIRA